MKKKSTTFAAVRKTVAAALEPDTARVIGTVKPKRGKTPPASLPEQLAQIAKRGQKSGGLSDARIVPPVVAPPPVAPPAPAALSPADIAAARTSAAKQAWATRRADPNSAYNRNRAAKAAAEAAAAADAKAAAEAAAEAAAALAAREAAAARKPKAAAARKPTARRTA